MRAPFSAALGVALACAETIACAEDSEASRRFFSASASVGGELAWGKTGESGEFTTPDAAWYSAYRTERRGVGPTFEVGGQSRSRRDAFGGMLAMSWLHGSTTITSGDPRATVSNDHRMILVSATGDWRVDESSPFHGGGALGLGGLFDSGPTRSTSGLLVGTLWFGADWALGGSNIVVGPRARFDAGVGDSMLLGGSLLLDVSYWGR